jgi:ribonucleoside-diphosphate reductase beta chain
LDYLITGKEMPENTEPFLDPRNGREFLKPIVYEDIFSYYKTHQSAFWVADEVDLSKDINTWRNVLNDDEKYFVKNVLAFFAASDIIVNENEKKKTDEVHIPEYKMMVNSKMEREDVHTESYANMIESYVDNDEEKLKLKRAVTTIPSVKKKADWFKQYIYNGSFAQREVSGSITEGIFFSGSFCAIFWLKKRGLMAGLCDYNELISRDEGLHRDFNCMIYKKYIVNKLPEAELINMIKTAVDIEIEFCTESLPVSLIGMNKEMMSDYIRFVADSLSMKLIDKKIYNAENPFSWMTLISLETKTDFFAHRPTNYSRQANMTDKSDNKIQISDDY